mgnify:CR=1 FL=1
MAEDYKLIDNEEKHRYEFQIDDKIAKIDYIKSNNGEIYLVPWRKRSRFTACRKDIGGYRTTRFTLSSTLSVCSRIHS